MDHCFGYAYGPNAQFPTDYSVDFDPIAAMKQWKVTGTAPDQIAVTTKDKEERKRLVCASPNVSQYKGTGSTGDPAKLFLQEVLTQAFTRRLFQATVRRLPSRSQTFPHNVSRHPGAPTNDVGLWEAFTGSSVSGQELDRYGLKPDIYKYQQNLVDSAVLRIGRLACARLAAAAYVCALYR